MRDFLPRAARLHFILLFDWRHGKWGSFRDIWVKAINDLFSFGITDCKAAGPLAADCVNRLLFSAFRIQRCGEAVLLPREPALAGIIDSSGVTG